jgi:hypothetical protein
MGSQETSRTVTRARCAACGAKFKASRRDARYCSGRCRQRALRARAEQDDLLRQLEEAKRHYWGLVRRYAEALGEPESRVLEGEAQFVDEARNVWIRGEFAGHGRPPRSGEAGWGLEPAGPPWSPPTDWIHQNFGPARAEKDPDYRERLQAIGRILAEDPAPCLAGHGPASLPDGSPAAPMSEREFATTTADPPWQYDNRASRGAAENHYPVMSIEDLCGLFDRLARDGS